MRTYEKPGKQPSVAPPTQLAGSHRPVRTSTQTGPRAQAIHAALRDSEKRAAQNPASAAKRSKGPEPVVHTLPEVEVTAEFPLSNQEIIDEIYQKSSAIERKVNSEIQERWKLDRPGPRFKPIQTMPYDVSREWAFEVGGNLNLHGGIGVGLGGKVGAVNLSANLDLEDATILDLSGSWNSTAGPQGEVEYAGKNGGVVIGTGVSVDAGLAGHNLLAASLGQSFRAKDGSYSEYERHASLTPEIALDWKKHAGGTGHDEPVSVSGIRPDGVEGVDKTAAADADADPQIYRKPGSTDFIKGGDYFGLDFGIEGQLGVGGGVGVQLGMREMEIFKTHPRDRLIKQLLSIRKVYKTHFPD